MPQGDSRYLAKWGAKPPQTVQKAVGADTSKLTFTSLLTYPAFDLAGDYVEPEGCDFAPHRLDPVIDLEHRRHPLIKGLPVASAMDSLWEPDGTYSVIYRRLNFADEGKPDIFHTVPIGTEYYDKSLRHSMQVFAMREQGACPASSLEFSPVTGFAKALGRSPLEDRPAYHFAKCRVHRWTVCAAGVNPGALLVEKALPQVPDLLSKILQDRRINVGGKVETLCGVILKALAPYVPPVSRTTVRVEMKAMGDETQTATAPELETANDAAVETEPTATPTAEAAYNLAQGARDLCDQIREAASKGEHKPGRKKLTALCQKLDSIAEMAMSVGKQVDADLSDDVEPAEGDETAEEKPEPEATDDDMEEDDEDGMLKGIPPVYRKAIKRFTLKDLETPAAAAPVVAPVEEEPSPELKKAFADFQKWKKHAGN